MQLVVGRIAKAHGIAGEVVVEVRTDDPEHRYTVGAALDTDPARDAPLTIAAARWHSGRLLVRFEGVGDRNAAEALRGTLLVAESDTSRAGDDDDFWDHDLVGLSAVTVGGEPIGTVSAVLHPPGAALLVVDRGMRGEALVPFVRDIVPQVDIDGGRLTVDPPEGLLDL
ncbi:MAG TPA: ribosome maturation factor RimM [Mycobacteriales bacterium]|jgi:16S rRNA processing protein RimM|nr:ribosome maturation factor RimM [Mycobacteriales bacterium]